MFVFSYYSQFDNFLLSNHMYMYMYIYIYIYIYICFICKYKIQYNFIYFQGNQILHEMLTRHCISSSSALKDISSALWYSRAFISTPFSSITMLIHVIHFPAVLAIFQYWPISFLIYSVFFSNRLIFYSFKTSQFFLRL